MMVSKEGAVVSGSLCFASACESAVTPNNLSILYGRMGWFGKAISPAVWHIIWYGGHHHAITACSPFE